MRVAMARTSTATITTLRTYLGVVGVVIANRITILVNLVAEAMILITIAVGVLTIVLILSSIRRVEIVIESVLSTIQLGTPVLGVFCNHFIAASASLGVIVIRRDSDYILGIDLNDHCVTSVAIGEVGKICNRTEVQSVGASAILVLIHFVAKHLTDLANRVVKCPTMDVLVISFNILEGEEVTILCDRKLSNLKEVVEFIDCTIARILHHIVEEVEQRLEGKVLLHERDHTLCHGVVDDLTLEHDATIYDLDIIV
jgi:hypothetical protein